MIGRMSRRSIAGRVSRVIGGRGWAELILLFAVVALVSTLVASRLVERATGAPAGSGSGLLAVLAIAALAGVAGVLGTVWSWWRDGGRPAQRIGRRAWRSARLPEPIGARITALRDLRRRRLQLQRQHGATRIGVVVGWVLLAATQVWLDHSLESVVLWSAMLAVVLCSGIRDALDRRRLPELDALLTGGAQAGDSTPVRADAAV